jgi:hypothetical protein
MNWPGFYCGVGSRRTPPDVLDLMVRISRRLHDEGWILRSGGAPGADTAFEAGAGVKKQVFLPWPGFNGRASRYDTVGPRGLALAERVHPHFATLNRASRLLMTRNGYQVLGASLERPSAFVLCWTPDGCTHAKNRSAATGGTGQAISIASAHRIPVFNLRRDADRIVWEDYADGSESVADLLRGQ